MQRLSKHFFLLGGLSIILLLVPNLFSEDCVAESSPFVRQFIYNHQPLPDDDYIFRINNKETDLGSLRSAGFVNTTDVNQVSFSSNGEVLNATMQMQSDIQNNPPVLERRYDMLIDVFSDLDTDTSPRNDYVVGIIWRNNTWTEQIEELLDFKNIWDLDSRGISIVDSKEGINSTSFIDRDSNSVRLSLLLDQIGSPDKYRVAFRTSTTYQNGSSVYEIVDFTPSVQIPLASSSQTESFFVSERDVASSPSFSNRQILDETILQEPPWIDLDSRNATYGGDRSTDIEAVDYFSNGETLNATLWTFLAPSIQQPPINEEVVYGMFIDADFDNKTGWGGIDYKVELSWDNKSKIWNQVLEKWSYYGDQVVIDNQTMSYTSFAKKGEHYVLLSADLSSMLAPNKYKIIFYASATRDGSPRADFTRWVSVPSLELSVSTSPSTVEMRKDEVRTIEIRVNTTQGYEPMVNLDAQSQSKKMIFDFTHNDTVEISKYQIRIPSHGVATVPLTITALDDAFVGPHTVFISANSSFPPEEFISASTQDQNLSSLLPPVPSENIITHSTLLLTLDDALTLIDHISSLWSKLGDILTFISGIVAGYVGPWIYNKMRQQIKDHREQREQEQK